MNRSRTSTTRVRGRTAFVLLLFVLLSQGCQFIQNEFWVY